MRYYGLVAIAALSGALATPVDVDANRLEVCLL